MDERRAIFLDRDGVLNEDHGYVGQPERFNIYPYVGPALRLLADKGFILFIVTNQSGIERGYFTMEDVHHLHRLLAENIRPFNVQFEDIFISPHRQDTPSDTRKPSPKFVIEAARQHRLHLNTSYVIGDRSTDLQMGYNAGCRVVLLRSGAGRETEKIPDIKYDFVFNDLLEAAQSLH